MTSHMASCLLCFFLAATEQVKRRGRRNIRTTFNNNVSIQASTLLNMLIIGDWSSCRRIKNPYYVLYLCSRYVHQNKLWETPGNFFGFKASKIPFFPKT